MGNILNFAETLMKLKDIKRTGWLRSRVSDPESVADHSYSLSMLTYLFSKKLGLNEEKAIKMALIHDINEILTGDIATRSKEEYQGVDNATKRKMENKNTKKILSLLPKELRMEALNLWDDFLNLRSKEAKLVHNLDKLDYSVQAMFYKKNKRTKTNLRGFIKTADQSIQMTEIRKTFEKIKKIMS